MNIKDISYVDYGENKKGVIVLLHGWGQNIEMMDMLGKPFEKDYRIIILDLPGFGKTKEPDVSWSVKDYTLFLHNFLNDLKVDNPILIGHSFGGRISICYSSMYKTRKVVLLSSPFRPSKSKKVNYRKIIYSFVKKVKILDPLRVKLQKKWGSEDYKNASVINRGTLVKVVNEDLTEYAKKIKCPVVLIYGTLDEAVDFKEAIELEKIIPDAGLIKYEGAHHYAYLERLNQTLAIIENFLEAKE